MKRFLVLFAVLAACSPEQKSAPTPTDEGPAAAAVPATEAESHVAPTLSDVPDGPFGEAVRRGAQIFRNTPKYASKYVGNSQSCTNCHIDGGRIADAAPMWGAWGMYPAYRKKNGHVNTMEERIQGCFTYSENAQASEAGAAPPAGDPVLADLQAYMFWLSKGVPAGVEQAGRGFPKLERPANVSVDNGAKVYEAQCALCHGANGAGVVLESGHQQFPPLWGKQAYNWGAGMHRINTAAGFIKANMPLGNAKLTDQEAWDVAAFINSHPRPADPRQTGEIEANDAKHHDEDCSYGDTRDGAVLGLGVQ